MKKYLLISMIAVTVASCTSRSSVSKGQPSLAATQWVLADEVKSKPTLVIEGDKVSGNAGCNNYFSELTSDPALGSFSTKTIGSTRKICDNMSEEKAFLDVLPQVNKYVVVGNTLELYKDGLLLLKFNKQ